MVIGETGSPFSPVAYRLLGTQTPDEIFPAIRLPVDTGSGKQTGILAQETQWAGSLGT